MRNPLKEITAIVVSFKGFFHYDHEIFRAPFCHDKGTHLFMGSYNVLTHSL